MAVYEGIGGVARQVANMYEGIGGVARQIVKGWEGVGGVAREFYSNGYWYSSGQFETDITYNDDRITLQSDCFVFSGASVAAQIVCNKSIDFSKYTKLCMTVYVTGMGENYANFRIRTQVSNNDSSTVINYKSYSYSTIRGKDKFLVEIPLSSTYVGTCHIGWSNTSSSNRGTVGSMTFYVYEIWME